ncbi:MAG: sulfurtransferase TusA family protein [Hyphomicrobiaceae bacterium]
MVKTLDARDLRCPIPILKTKRALADVPVGRCLEILATDPGSPDDFVAFCDSTGHELISQSLQSATVHRFVIRRTA